MSNYRGQWGLSPFEKIIMSPERRLKTRDRLVKKQGGKCKFCKCVLGAVSKKPYPSMSTIEHIYHSFDIRRALTQNVKIVACCYQCNQKREEQFAKYFFKDYNFFKKADLQQLLFKTLDKENSFWDWRKEVYEYNGGRIAAVSEFGTKINRRTPRKKKKIVEVVYLRHYYKVPLFLLKVAVVWGLLLYFLIN